MGQILAASEFLQAFGPIPRVLSRTVRAIRNAEALFSHGGAVDLHEVLAGVTELVFRAPTNEAVLVAAVEEMHPMHLDDYPEMPAAQLTRFLGPAETMAVLSLSFLTRRLSQVCDPEPWGILTGRMRQQIAIGRILGDRMPRVGGGRGMLLAGLPFVAVGSLLATCPKEFSQYQAAFRSSKRLWDTAREQELFGVSHLEVAAALAREVGLGATFSTTFLPRRSAELGSESESERFRLIQMCELLQIFGDPRYPECACIAERFEPAVIEGLAENIEEVLKNPRVSEWLFASGRDEVE